MVLPLPRLGCMRISLIRARNRAAVGSLESPLPQFSHNGYIKSRYFTLYKKILHLALFLKSRISPAFLGAPTAPHSPIRFSTSLMGNTKLPTCQSILTLPYLALSLPNFWFDRLCATQSLTFLSLWLGLNHPLPCDQLAQLHSSVSEM